MPDRICSIDGCDTKVKAKGLCVVHYRRADIGGTCAFCGIAFTGDRRNVFCSLECRANSLRARPVAYSAAHRRVTRERGSARLLLCVDCGRQAADWSYTNEDPDALIEVGGTHAGMPYSTNTAYYVPRCKSCHKIFDRLNSPAPLLGERVPGHKLTADQVRNIRARYAAGGVTLASLGMEHGVSKNLIHQIVHRRAWAWIIP